MDDFGNCRDIGFEQPEGAGICQHQGRGVGADRRPERVQINGSVGVGGDFHHFQATDGGGGRVGAMGRVGDDDGVARGTAVLAVIGLDHQDARQFSVRSGRGLECRGVHARYLHEGPFQVPHQLQGALGLRLVLIRVQGGESGQSGHLVVDLGVVLHSARPQWIETQVHRVVEMGEPGVVAHHLGFRELRQSRRAGAEIDAGKKLGHL